MNDKNQNNEMKGVLGENLYKENSKHPDMKGKCQIGGKEYLIAGWLKEGKNGSFYSLSFTDREDKKQTVVAGSKLIKPKAVSEITDDEMPF